MAEPEEIAEEAASAEVLAEPEEVTGAEGSEKAEDITEEAASAEVSAEPNEIKEDDATK